MTIGGSLCICMCVRVCVIVHACVPSSGTKKIINTEADQRTHTYLLCAWFVTAPVSTIIFLTRLFVALRLFCGAGDSTNSSNFASLGTTEISSLRLQFRRFPSL